MKRIVLIILTILCVILVYDKVTAEEIIIPDMAIRLRVIPHSNDANDIVMKEKVKDYLESNVYNLFKETEDVASARKIINDNLDNIDKEIGNIFKENNYNMKYNINYGYNHFPVKKYNDIVYPEGEYESLVVSIGEAKGDNWWCVLFPSFCLLDSKETTDVEYKFFVKKLIDKYF